MTTSGAFLAGSLAGGPAQARGTTPGVTSAGAPMRIGTVALTVRDLDTVSRFYREVIGLTPIETGTGLARLGVGETALLELRHDPAAPLASPRAAGLFHIAFLVPNRTDLAQWLLHAAERRVPLQGASDHLVSEAIYLADPEGNGIEVYWDRPSETWSWRDGMVEMATLALDLNGLVAPVKTRDWAGLPIGSLIGHVHLQVGALDASDRFYADLLGFEVMTRYPGATFLGSGGYHHHIGTNIWNSRGAPVRSEPTTGLADVEIVAEPGTLETLRSRLSPEQASEAGPMGLPLRDPWGTSITVVTAES
ncbi:VOC family protein [Microvirga sp. TS319]|uniref:VOC family protein n=1 Tax=Microvirga sp. TS319 TaxID=3241165 RepID=UPI00351A1937